MGVRLKHPLHHRDQDRLRWKGIRGAATHCQPAQHRMERSPLGPWFLQWEKRAQQEHPAPPALRVTLWEAPLWSCLMRMAGEPVGFDPRDLTMMEKVGGA